MHLVFMAAAVGAVERNIAAADVAAEAMTMKQAAERMDQMQLALSDGWLCLCVRAGLQSERCLVNSSCVKSAGFGSLNEKLKTVSRVASQMLGAERSASFVSLADPLSSMKEMIVDTPVSVAPDMSAINAASDIIKGIASVDAPLPAPTPLDPRRVGS
jgi:hypothetical protein